MAKVPFIYTLGSLSPKYAAVSDKQVSPQSFQVGQHGGSRREPRTAPLKQIVSALPAWHEDDVRETGRNRGRPAPHGFPLASWSLQVRHNPCRSECYSFTASGKALSL